ncbi:helix-turn-helix transcriptional regulator [Amycolatopsis lurida]
MISEQDSGGTELGQFLRDRRAKVTPAEVGLPAGAGLRRTPGLRREELAGLAQVSIDYYTRLEQGRKTRPSPSVVDALALALRLDEADHEHLRALAARVAQQAPEHRAMPDRKADPSAALMVERLRPNPAHLLDPAMNLLAWNTGGLRMYAGIDQWPVERRNIARYLLFHPAARELFDDWEAEVHCCVGYLRASARNLPDSPALTDFLGELQHTSPEFARLWKRPGVRGRPHGRKKLHHPVAGTITLRFQVMLLLDTDGQRTVTYYADSGSPDHDAMVMLDMATDEYPASPRGFESALPGIGG